MTTDPPIRQLSLLRLLWRGTTLGPFPPVVALGLVPAAFLTLAWSLWHGHRLDSAALGWRLPIWMLGNFLVSMYAGAGWGKRRRPFMLLDPMPAPSGAGPSLDDPGAIVVAGPILTGVGTACLGFAFGLNVIISFSNVEPVSESWTSIAMYLLIALTIVVAVYGVADSTRRLYIWSQDVAASAATAAADADRARITALQAQMNPHFLFNALNTVASLLGSDGVRARRTVQNLSGMLTHTLQRSAQPLTTLEDELQFVRDYLDIERERFGARLQVTYQLEPDTAAMAVPTMSLQPLVENAIKHAVMNRLEGGHIRIAASKRAEPAVTRLSVEDDGPGFAPGSEEGTGLGNLRARLRSLYGPAAELVTETLPTGARVTLTLPPSASARQAPARQS